MDARVATAHALAKVEKFNGNLLILGCGSVSQCTVPILLKLLELDPKRVTVLDFVDNSSKIKTQIEQGVTYVVETITPQNYEEVFLRYLKNEGDILLDLVWNTSTADFLDFCRRHGFLFANTSVEEPDPYEQEKNIQDPRLLTLYARQMGLRNLVEGWKNKPVADNRKIKSPSACVDHGANPGLVSHFVKRAMVDIVNHQISNNKLDGEKKEKCLAAIKDKKWNILAQLIGLKTVHVSERDSQIANDPKKFDEFVNTWSIPGIVEEALAPSEVGWGTHELTVPPRSLIHNEGPCNQIALCSRGMNTMCRSWVPSGPIVGFIIRHGEAYGISDRFTVWENDVAVYRPTVHYVYCPCDAAIASLHEYLMKNYTLQPNLRIMSDEIIAGKDELGCTLYGDFGAWWVGSVLSIDEARKIISHQNATTMQVAISIVACLIYLIRNPNLGFCLPDDLDYEEILKYCYPYLGEFVSKPTDWTPYGMWSPAYDTKGLESKITFKGGEKFDPTSKHAWQFTDFLVNPIFLEKS